MLIEAALFALSLPATPVAFRTHISYGIGLWSRGRRQAAAWRPHLEATRRFILRASEESSGGTLAVLGSGPLFDVPLEQLAARFDRVLLVDRMHLFPARRRASRHANVELAWRDLAAPLDFLAAIPDLARVISVNLLSQLAHGAPVGAEQEIIAAHLAALAALPCPATLITDIAYEIIGRDGRIRRRFDQLHGVELPRPEASWRWHLAPFGEESRTARRDHLVAAFSDWRRHHPPHRHAEPGFQPAEVLLLPLPSTP